MHFSVDFSFIFLSKLLSKHFIQDTPNIIVLFTIFSDIILYIVYLKLNIDIFYVIYTCNIFSNIVYFIK